ncbi:GNAT family N-acetyltransferase [Haloimpatiens massiliensis]|uniref:GNAT family N-acetyltransferase n=1 Tax=Haloimpatiens massiliensis TaxID=1658110 RepID=UPI000C8519BA|nr:GNAT family N-acetyltransferase [Haloimpatiens massiliensis]
MEITFKNATEEDKDKIFELNKNLIEKYETNFQLDFQKIFTWIKKKIQNNIESYMCIYIKGVKVGYFYLHTDGEKLELDDLYIFKEFQGRGIGTEVLKYIDLVSKDKNKDIFLYVFVKNKGAVNLYLRNGYKIVENIHDSRYIMEKSTTIK